jgi:hypothetical protein
VEIVFETDSSNSGRGFKVEYKAAGKIFRVCVTGGNPEIQTRFLSISGYLDSNSNSGSYGIYWQMKSKILKQFYYTQLHTFS